MVSTFTNSDYARVRLLCSRPLITKDQPNGHEDLTHCACVLGVYLTTQSITRFVEKVLVERFEMVCKTQDLKTIAITYRPDL